MPYELEKFVDFVKKIQDQDLDVLIAVDGMKGVGKSTLALQLARHYLKKYWNYTDSDFKKNLHKFIAYDNMDVLNKIENAEDGQPLVCDEAVRFALAEDWMKQESKEIKKMFTQMRTKHLFVIFCIPDFFWIDKKYMLMVTAWIHVYARGRSVIFFPDQRIGVEDRWHRKEFKRLLKVPVFMFDNPEKIQKACKRHPNFFDFLSFPPLPQDIYQDYKKVRDNIVFSPTPRLVPNWHLDVFLYNVYKHRLNGSKESYTKLVELFRDPFTGKLPWPSFDAGRKWVETRIREVESWGKQVDTLRGKL